MKPKICFISTTRQNERPLFDPSVRYRCFHPAEMLVSKGAYCVVYSAQKFFNEPCFDFDIYIFHRPTLSPQYIFLPKIIDMLRALKRTVIADYDDLIIGTEDIALSSSMVKNQRCTQEEALLLFKQNTDALLLFDKVFTSTYPLAEQIKAFNKSVTIKVIPNILPDSILAFGDLQKLALRPHSKEYIGYFAGTKSHDKDIEIIEDVLHRVLSENENYRFFVVGPIALPQSIASLPNVLTMGPLSYYRLFNIMSMCSTVIAPLEDTIFNNCKSRVKFLEASLSGCHLIASPIYDMEQIGPKYMTLAYSKDDWYEALSSPKSLKEREQEVLDNFRFIKDRSTINQILMEI